MKSSIESKFASRQRPQYQCDNAVSHPARTSESLASSWCEAFSSESEQLSAAVLCAAIAANTQAITDPNASAEATATASRDASLRELEDFIRSSPLPHKLQLPVIEFSPNYVVVESAHSVICAVRATKSKDIVEAVLGSTAPLAQPYVYRYGGARIHLPFWKRAKELDVRAIYNHARQREKTLVFCGHSIAGSIAQLGLFELVYQELPVRMRQALEKKDAQAREKDRDRSLPSKGLNHRDDDDVYRSVSRVSIPQVVAIGFGSPYIGSHALTSFLDALGLNKCLGTLVNELDCIPGILNVAQTAAMLTKTTERLVTIAKATETLVKLLPAQMQSVFVALGKPQGGIASVTSAYITMSLQILQSTFEKLRDHNVIKDTDYQYAPCGMYLFLKRKSKEVKLLTDTAAVLREFHKGEAATATLTGNSILQHLMSSYVDAIVRRSSSIQISESMNHYERLGVPRNATPGQIRSAYRTLALQWHPDRWSSAASPRERDLAEQVFKLLAESCTVLSDPEARAAYDAHLERGPSWNEEFVRDGTVGGMTLDEAISTFRDVVVRATGTVSKVADHFGSSGVGVISLGRFRRVDPLGLVPNNHTNLFAPGRVRVARRIDIGTGQQEKIFYLLPDELMPGDVAAPSIATQNAGESSARAGMKTILGGAVVVGAGIAIAVTAWSQYSERAKREMQAKAVRKMPGEYLLLLLDDHRAHRPRVMKAIESDHRHKKMIAAEAGGDASVDKKVSTQAKKLTLAVRDPDDRINITSTTSKVEGEDDEHVEAFVGCAAKYEEARLQAFAEDEFFDCLDIAKQVASLFQPSSTAADQTGQLPEVTDQYEHAVDIFGFPVGSVVHTPFGLGSVEDWRPTRTSAVIRFGLTCVGFIEKKDITRGASQALIVAKTTMEEKREALSEYVVEQFGLERPQESRLRGLVKAGTDGALDSGLRAAGGMAIAKGMSRASTKLGGAVAAPLAIASVLVDIGKDYYDYRQKHTERENKGVLSPASERLMMRDFRLKAGQHVVSGTAAAAGASLGVYSAASVALFWTGVGFTGPIGMAAATGAAVVGGILGTLAGSKAYDRYTSKSFTSFNVARERIDRLELGARVLFDEYDPKGSGEITKTDCIELISKLYEASGSVSKIGYRGILAVIQDDTFEGPVGWPFFWEWVKTEAEHALRKLEEEEMQVNPEVTDAERESWWKKPKSYFLNAPTTTAADDSRSVPQETVHKPSKPDTLRPVVNGSVAGGAKSTDTTKTTPGREQAPSQDQIQIEALCSLLSNEGLQRYLYYHTLQPPATISCGTSVPPGTM